MHRSESKRKNGTVTMDQIVIVGALFLVALLYSSVGHAGASGFIAVLALFQMAPQEIKPTVLVLNILVATIASWNFYRAGYFSWNLLLPLVLLSIPCAFLGGYLQLPSAIFKVLLGLVLWASALRFLIDPAEKAVGTPPRGLALGVTGGVIGFLAGLTSTGGGIFLTPWLLYRGWATTKKAASLSAVFILVNSISGLAGYASSAGKIPPQVWIWLTAVGFGGWIGSTLGSRFLAVSVLRRCLAAVLFLAGGKLIFLS